MHARFKDQVEFFAVYINEAHPTDGWRSGFNDKAGIKIAQATNFEERLKAACECCEGLNMTVPLVIDGIDNRVGKAYSGFPDRLYLIDKNGKVAYKGGRGPFGFIPQELEQSLILSIIGSRHAASAKTVQVEE
jgi:hypothetical protein